MNTKATTAASAIDHIRTRFLTILPRITIHARCYFRHLSGPKRDDAIAETIGLSWKWFFRMAQRGKDATRFPMALASYAARAVRSGRRVCGQEKAKDVLSSLAQQRHGFIVTKLVEVETLTSNPLIEALIDNTTSPVPDQAAFRIDFPTWFTSWDERRRSLITNMAQGERTKNLARQFGVSPGRISQMRQEFHNSWEQFHGETTGQ